MPLDCSAQFPTTFRFTKTALAAAIEAVVASGEKQIELCDTELPNFHLLIYSTGRATYTSRYVYRRRKTSKKVGDFRVLSLEQARAIHRERMVSLARGENPAQTRQARLTFAEFSEQFLALGKGKKRSHNDDVEKFKKRLNPTFGKLPLADIMTARLNSFLHSLHTKEGLSKATVNQYGSLLRRVFKRAIEMGALPSGRNPMAPIKAFPVDNAPKDFMSLDDMRAFLAAADQDENRLAAILLILLLLTGARLSELLYGRWSQVDLERRQWRLSADQSKNGRAAIIPLPTPAIPLLEELALTRRNEWVFPGQRGNAVMSRPAKAFERICARAGLAGRGFVIHSLRHAYCSALANAGVPLWSIQMVVRHRTSQMVQRYSHVHAATLAATTETLTGLLKEQA